MVEVEDLYKKYGEFTAVAHLNLTVADGEVLGFVGPNGAGKTTTMKIMAGEQIIDGAKVAHDNHIGALFRQMVAV